MDKKIEETNVLNLLNGMKMTESWVRFDNLQTFLNEDSYGKLLDNLRADIEEFFLKLRTEDFTEQDTRNFITEELQRKRFKVALDENGEYMLQEETLSRDKICQKIIPSDIQLQELAPTVEEIMQKHLDYGSFHRNRYLDAEQIPETLQQYINIAREYQGKETRDFNQKDEKVIREKNSLLRKQSVEAAKTYFGNLDDAVAYLQTCRKDGANVFIDFNGDILYSCDVTVDSAYMQVVGMTKEEDDAIRNEFLNAKTSEEKAVIIEKWENIREKYKQEAKKTAVVAEKNFFAGGLDEAIKYLQDSRRRGENVFVDFNGAILYSSDVTVDSAYMQVVGMTKEEDDAIRNEFLNAKTDEEKAVIIEKWEKTREKHKQEAEKDGEKVKEATPEEGEKDNSETHNKTIEDEDDAR